MSFATIYSRAVIGIEAKEVKIEVHLSNGLPAFQIVGLPDAGVRESRDRVRSAIINSQLQFPQTRLTVNLSPADIPKEGSRYDLAIAIGILVASKQLPDSQLHQYEFFGELGLNGELRETKAIIPCSIATTNANRTGVYVTTDATQATIIKRASVLPAKCLLDVFNHFSGQQRLSYIESSCQEATTLTDDCLSDVIGQEQAKRALEIAAAGQHNLLMMGAPGTGKSMLAHRLLSILPELTDDEALTTSAIHSIVGKPITTAGWKHRPFRSPHHTVSGVALVGGGSPPKPGEVSLAQNGVLFLDELPEFGRKALDVLREPMEVGKVTISRAAHQAEFPCQFQLVAALNPSPTGHYNDGRTSSTKILQYLSKISGPILDRIDLQIEVATLPASMLITSNKSETSEQIKKRVVHARTAMLARCGKPNALLSSTEVTEFCNLSESLQSYIEQMLNKLNLSVRVFHKVLKVARTIADLEKSQDIQQHHLAEALSYRAMDRLIQYLVKQS